jgi:hypothetical protein
MAIPLEKEIATYNARLGEMLQHVGKFVLIKGDEVLGYFDAYADALREGYKTSGEEPFMVKRVAPHENVYFFTRDLDAECRAST